MVTTKRPFQVAFWALLMAFGLSVIVAVSDPRAVRLAILAKAENSPSHPGNDTVLVADHEQTTPSVEGTSAVTIPATEREPTLALDVADWPEIDRESSEDPSLIHTQPVSSPAGQQAAAERDLFRRESGATMIVVSPEQLHRTLARNKEVEFLPPPPGMDDASEPLELGNVTDTFGNITDEPARPSQRRRTDEPDLSRQWLEAEILRLRQEVDRLSEAQQLSERLDRLHHQQQELLALHQNLPVDRLLEVIDLLRQQLSAVRQTIPPPPRDPPATSGLLTGESPLLMVEPSQVPQPPSATTQGPAFSHSDGSVPPKPTTSVTSSRCASCHEGRIPAR